MYNDSLKIDRHILIRFSRLCDRKNYFKNPDSWGCRVLLFILWLYPELQIKVQTLPNFWCHIIVEAIIPWMLFYRCFYFLNLDSIVICFPANCRVQNETAVCTSFYYDNICTNLPSINGGLPQTLKIVSFAEKDRL